MSKETISFRKDKLKGILKNKKITNSEKEVIKGYYKKQFIDFVAKRYEIIF